MPVITISRELGSGGTYIALKLAEALGCNSYDKEILNEIAEKLGKNKEQIADFDQETYNRVGVFFQEALSSIAHGGMVFHPFGIGPLDWDSGQMFSTFPSDAFLEEDYVSALSKVMKEILTSGSAVILGRGGSQILKEDRNVFHIRVVADIEDRVKRIMAEQSIEEEKARSLISQKDESASKFIYDFFGEEVSDHKHYHLIINTSKIPLDESVGIILKLLKRD